MIKPLSDQLFEEALRARTRVYQAGDAAPVCRLSAPPVPAEMQEPFHNPIEKIKWIMANQEYGFHLFNYISTLGAYLTGIAVVMFLMIALWTAFFGRRVGANYWNVQPQTMTLEWTVSSPPPFHQFDIQPKIN